MFTAEAPTRGVRQVGSSWPHLPQSFSFSRVFLGETSLPKVGIKGDGRRQKRACFVVFNGRRPLASPSAAEHQSRTRLAIQEKRNRYGAQPGITYVYVHRRGSYKRCQTSWLIIAPISAVIVVYSPSAFPDWKTMHINPAYITARRWSLTRLHQRMRGNILQGRRDVAARLRDKVFVVHKFQMRFQNSPFRSLWSLVYIPRLSAARSAGKN